MRGARSQPRQFNDGPDSDPVRILMQPRFRDPFAENDTNSDDRLSGKIRGAPRRKGSPNQQKGESGKNRDLEKE